MDENTELRKFGGFVHDGHGLLVPGASVTLEFPNASGTETILAVTDLDGEFLMLRVPAYLPKATLRISAPNLRTIETDASDLPKDKVRIYMDYAFKEL